MKKNIPSQHPYALDYPEAQLVAELLSINTGKPLSASDFCNWMEPEDHAAYLRFDRAAYRFLGRRLYSNGEVAARLSSVLLVALGLRIAPAHEHRLALDIINSTYAGAFAAPFGGHAARGRQTARLP